MRLGTCVMQHATDDSQNMYQTRCDVGQATDITHQATLGTGAGHRKTDKSQRAADTIRQTAMPQTTQGTTCKTPPETVQQTPRHMQRATGKMQRTTRNVQQKPAGNMRHAVDDMQHVTNSVQRAACSVQRAPDFTKHAASNNVMQRNRQHALGNGQRAACNRKPSFV